MCTAASPQMLPLHFTCEKVLRCKTFSGKFTRHSTLISGLSLWQVPCDTPGPAA